MPISTGTCTSGASASPKFWRAKSPTPYELAAARQWLTRGLGRHRGGLPTGDLSPIVDEDADDGDTQTEDCPSQVQHLRPGDVVLQRSHVASQLRNRRFGEMVETDLS